ncbi:MAG: DUF1934 domain-containing protein [Oscillospiraceae bacterium]|nr:DUF1934 domain-containing protein [Oscillospiraceae bacterium]
MDEIKMDGIDGVKKVLISIKGLPIFAEEDGEGFELMTDGEYLQADGKSTFRYEEGAVMGHGGLFTTFDVEPDRVILRRGDMSTFIRPTDIMGSGSILGEIGEGGDMIFCEKQKHNFLYNTPFGSVLLGIDTHSIKKDMTDDGGNLEIRYDIEVDNIAVSQNLFRINIKSLPQ